MNKVLLVGRLTRDPEQRSLPSGKAVANFVIATNEFRGSGAGERTEYRNVVAWDRLAEICGQFLSKGQLIDVEGRLQTRQWDDDAGVPPLEDGGRGQSARDAVRTREEGIRQGGADHRRGWAQTGCQPKQRQPPIARVRSPRKPWSSRGR